MKQSLLSIVASAMLFLFACTNENSSTVATFDDEEQSTTSHSSGEKGHGSKDEAGAHTQGIEEGTDQTSDINSRTGADSTANKPGQRSSTDTNRVKDSSSGVKVNARAHQ